MNLLARFSAYSWMPTSALNKPATIGRRFLEFPLSFELSRKLIQFETKAYIPSRITSWLLIWWRGFKTSLFALSPTCCNLFKYKHWKIVECPGHLNGKSFLLKIRMKVKFNIHEDSKDELVLYYHSINQWLIIRPDDDSFF